jgi:hypothetical protein
MLNTNMLQVFARGAATAAAVLLCWLSPIVFTGCNRGTDASSLGTFRMGERVQAGPLAYTVLEAGWRPDLQGKAPQHRFLLVRLSITNTSGGTVPARPLELAGARGKHYTEVTENLENFSEWLGLIRNIQPSQTETGYVVFDAPVAAYKLVITETAEEDEKQAYVDIPVELEH